MTFELIVIITFGTTLVFTIGLLLMPSLIGLCYWVNDKYKEVKNRYSKKANKDDSKI